MAQNTEQPTARVQYRDNFPETPTLIVDGVDITNKVTAGSLTIQHRADLPALVTFTLAADVEAAVTAEVSR